MADTSYNKDLQITTSWRQILRIAMPISFAIFIPQINFITNNIFLGHYDEQALAVAGITGVYYLVFAAIGFGLNNGLQMLIARRSGENRPEEIGKLFNQGIFIAMGIAIAGVVITWLATPFLFSYFITDASRLQQAIEFSKIRVWGLLFLYIYQMRNALLVGTNQSRLLVAGAVAETVMNIAFDYLLIFGRGGFPEMGLNGAAVASIIAEFSGMFVVFLIIRKKGISNRFHLFSNFRWDSYNFRLILSMSSPLIFQHAISVLSWEYFFLLTDSYGEMALAVSNIMRNLFGLSGIVIWAFAATSNTMVSNIIGQGKNEMVWPLLRKIMLLSAGCCCMLIILLNLFPGTVLAIYGQPRDFVELAVPVLRVVSVAMLLMSVSSVFLHAVTGSGNSRVTLLIEILAIIGYCIYVYLLMVRYKTPLAYGWTGEWLYWTTILIPSLLYMRSGRWKGKKI